MSTSLQYYRWPQIQKLKQKTWAKLDVKIYVVLLVLRIIVLFKKYIHL